MGFLLNAFNTATPAVAAQGSSTLGLLGAGMTAAGDISSGIGAGQQYGYQAGVAQNNAKIEQQNANNALLQGYSNEITSKMKYGALAGEQRAAYGANGVDVSGGTPQAVMNSTKTISAMDAALIHFNAAQQAFGDESQAYNYETQAGLYKKAAGGAVAGGILKAGASLLSSASSLGTRAATFKLQGAA